MQRWGPIAVVAIVAVATTADAASCRHKNNQNCFDTPATINFTSVPDISKQIVSEEPAPVQPKTTVVEAPPITTYTGPLVAVSPLAHAPTVGYYWSLEPDSGK
jgi:hypothetical protein